MAQKPAPKKRGRKPKLDQQLVAAAIAELNGNVSAVARRFGVQRASVQEMVAKSPALAAILADARTTMLDNVESRFYADCLKNDPAYQTSRIFFLKTQGKGRGYVERTETEQVGLSRLLIVEEELRAGDGGAADGAAAPGPAGVPPE